MIEPRFGKAELEAMAENARRSCQDDALTLSRECEEVIRLQEGIKFWSYCARQGMEKWCPELRSRLKDFHDSCGVTP